MWERYKPQQVLEQGAAGAGPAAAAVPDGGNDDGGGSGIDEDELCLCLLQEVEGQQRLHQQQCEPAAAAQLVCNG